MSITSSYKSSVLIPLIVASWQQATSTHENETEVNSVSNLDTIPIYAKDHLSELWLRKKKKPVLRV